MGGHCVQVATCVRMLAATRVAVRVRLAGYHEALALDGLAVAVERWHVPAIGGFDVTLATGYGLPSEPRVAH